MSLLRSNNNYGNITIQNDHHHHTSFDESSVQFLNDYKIELMNREEDELISEIQQLILRVFPDESKVQIQRQTGGNTNRLYKVKLGSDHTNIVLVRINGLETERLIDRKKELHHMIELGKRGVGSRVYAAFQNGFIYEYVEGTVLKNAADASKYCKEIARKLAEWHKLRIKDTESNNLSPSLFNSLRKWIEIVKNMEWKNKEIQGKFEKEVDFQRICSDVEKIANNDYFMQKGHDNRQPILADPTNLSQVIDPFTIGFCHNDLVILNIIASSATNTSKVQFIDCEYCGYNYRGFDIGNHFNEYCGFEMDETLFPSRDTQETFVREYLKSFIDPAHSHEITQQHVKLFLKSIPLFCKLSHLYWALWGIIQSNVSNLEFDFLSYAKVLPHTMNHSNGNNKNSNVLFQSVISDKHHEESLDLHHHHESPYLPAAQHRHQADESKQDLFSSPSNLYMNHHGLQLMNSLPSNFAIGTAAAVFGRTLSIPFQQTLPLWSGQSITFARYIYQSATGLTAGFSSCLTKFAPAQALALSLRDLCKSMLVSTRVMHDLHHENDAKRQLMLNITSGALAGAASHVVLHPFEHAQMRYFTYLSKHRVVSQFKGPVHFVVSTSGFTSLFKGFGIGLVNAVTNRGLLFGVYDSLNVNNPFRNQWDVYGIGSKLLIAQCATSISVLFSIPFLNIQREMILQSMTGNTSQDTDRYMSSLQTVRTMIARNGISSLFRGALVECLARRTSGTFILVMYDLLKEMWNEKTISLQKLSHSQA
ncbi:hypothetical protein FDP41_008346 [Naegleria fowleri]|uniref:ethanolamine kinase n=1 Tax=Naegleria fowleri TaxID=5763 RepID=A0A6A5BJA0_NAEFO|nr:uncharacterized protein FDP41_008346 [Naegleria fowleri]KAF0973139.1 hypothetical protein FDP41_008346 [Naegleria fowleri]